MRTVWRFLPIFLALLCLSFAIWALFRNYTDIDPVKSFTLSLPHSHSNCPPTECPTLASSVCICPTLSTLSTTTRSQSSLSTLTPEPSLSPELTAEPSTSAASQLPTLEPSPGLTPDPTTGPAQPSSTTRKKLLKVSPKEEFFTEVNNPHVCVLVRVYYKDFASLPALLFSLFAGSYPNLTVYLLPTDYSANKQADLNFLRSVENLLVDLYGADPKRVYLVSHLARPKKYSHLMDFGYILTDVFIDWLTDHYSPDTSASNFTASSNTSQPGFQPFTHSTPSEEDYQLPESPCDYLLVTNGDNLYTKSFFPSTISLMKAGFSAVGVDYVTHYHNNRKDQKIRDQQMQSDKVIGSGIDLGAVLLNMNLFTRSGHFQRFCMHELDFFYRNGTMEKADRTFFASSDARIFNIIFHDLIKKNLTQTHTLRVSFIHQ